MTQRTWNLDEIWPALLRLGMVNERTLPSWKADLERALLAATDAPKVDIGETSDGYHTFNELYDHRIALFLALCRTRSDAWKSRVHSDGSKFDGWFLVCIGRAPGTQISYHLPDSRWDEATMPEMDPAPFDGHTSAMVLKRLATLNPAPKVEPPIEPTRDAGKPGAPDGWKLGERWRLAEHGWKCHMHGMVHPAYVTAISNNYSVCLDIAKLKGYLVPAEPPVEQASGEADICVVCSEAGSRCKCSPLGTIRIGTPPAPGKPLFTRAEAERLDRDFGVLVPFADAPCHGQWSDRPCALPGGHTGQHFCEPEPVAPGKPDEAPQDEAWCSHGSRRPSRCEDCRAEKYVDSLRAQLADAEKELAIRTGEVESLRAAATAQVARIAELERQLAAEHAELLEWVKANGELSMRDGECVHCEAAINSGEKDHWQTCPLHPAHADKAAAVLAERERAISACETSIECFRCSGAGSIATGRGVVACGVCHGNRWLAPNSMQVAHRIKEGPAEFPGVQREDGAPAPKGTP